MKKPEKKAMLEGVEILTHEKEIKKFQDGYNQCWDDREAWLKEVASVEKIEKVILNTQKELEKMSGIRLFPEDRKGLAEDRKGLAKEIHKLLNT